MEPATCTAAKGKDADEDQNIPDPLTGDKADQDQQILIKERRMYWEKSTCALEILDAAFAAVVENEIKSLQEKTQTDFGRQLCKEATAEDIIKGKRRNQAYFEHACPGTPVSCQCLLNIIKKHTTDSFSFFKMLQGTNPQNWLKSPFEFVRLFLHKTCTAQDFQHCDTTALSSIIRRCKPLNQMFGSKFDAVRKARNYIDHKRPKKMSKKDMEDRVDVFLVFLDFLKHIKSLKNADEVNKAIKRIKQSLSDTEISSTSFEGMHTTEVSSKKLSECSDDSSDTSDSSFGPSQPKKFKPSVAASTENMAAAECKERRQKTDYLRRRKKIEPASADRNILKICSLNVNGLKGRFGKERKFVEFIKEHDIACFMETKIDHLSADVAVEGYTFYQNNRFVTKRRSGGIGIYVKNTIKVVEEIVCSCEYVLWLKIETVFEPLKETVVLGAVYIPCGRQKDDYAKIMEEFETEVESKRSEYKNVILAGDFNCSTGTLQDYTVNDHSADWFMKICALFKRLSIPLERSSQDKRGTTAREKKLINLCKREQMFILNGRLDSDKGKGEITCRIGKHSKGSVIDYVISTDTCLELFISFKVKDVTTFERFSDFHSALIFELG